MKGRAKGGVRALCGDEGALVVPYPGSAVVHQRPVALKVILTNICCFPCLQVEVTQTSTGMMTTFPINAWISKSGDITTATAAGVGRGGRGGMGSLGALPMRLTTSSQHRRFSHGMLHQATLHFYFAPCFPA